MADMNLQPTANSWTPVGNPNGEWGKLDPTVLAPDGTPSFAVMPPGYSPFNAECDGLWHNLKTGDHVILQAWVKTDAWLGSTDIHCGSFFAWDFYAQGYINGVLYSGIAMLDDYSGDVQMGHPSESVPYPTEYGYDGYNYGYTIDGSSDLHQISGNICRVPYNVLVWKFCRWEFWVPTRTFRRILTTVNGVQDIYVLDSPGQIHGMIPWLGAHDMYLRGHKVWFGQTEMYINPTETHLPTTKPTPEECTDQATCEANGYFWYDGACHLNPKTTTTPAVNADIYYWLSIISPDGIAITGQNNMGQSEWNGDAYSDGFDNPWGSHEVYTGELSIYAIGQAPAGPFAFGRQNVGNSTDSSLGGNTKNATRFLCSNTGILDKIIANVAATNGMATVRCAIYADNAGSPGALIAQTNEVVIGSALSWVEFSFAQTFILTINSTPQGVSINVSEVN